jgi:hypothetical protein
MIQLPSLAYGQACRHAEFKGLTSHVSGERRTAFSDFVGRQKYGEGNILISQWLLASLLKRVGEDLLNLKD